MTVEATYPDGTYLFVSNTFSALSLVKTIHAAESECPLKDMDLLSGSIEKEQFAVALKALSSFEVEDEKVDAARMGYVEAIQHAMDNGHEYLVFT